jgi:hypothetical protein
VQATGERRRQGDDDARRLVSTALRRDPDDRAVVGDAGDRLVEPDPVAQLSRQALGQLLHPAVDTGMLGTAFGGDQVLQPAP